MPAWGEVEEQQVGHQGHCQQHGLQFQAHPQEDRACNEAQDAAAGVVLQVGTGSCVCHWSRLPLAVQRQLAPEEGSKPGVCPSLGPLLSFQQRAAGKLTITLLDLGLLAVSRPEPGPSFL